MKYKVNPNVKLTLHSITKMSKKWTKKEIIKIKNLPKKAALKLNPH